MLRRKAVFLQMDAHQPTLTILDLVRDFVGMGYVPVPVVAAEAEVGVEDVVRVRTGAPVTRPLVLDGRFEPQRIWEFARSQDLDLSRSVLVAATPALDGMFTTAGLGRILRPADARLAA